MRLAVANSIDITRCCPLDRIAGRQLPATVIKAEGEIAIRRSLIAWAALTARSDGGRTELNDGVKRASDQLPQPLNALVAALFALVVTPALALCTPARVLAMEPVGQGRYRCHGEFDAVEVRALFFNKPPSEVILLYWAAELTDQQLRQVCIGSLWPWLGCVSGPASTGWMPVLTLLRWGLPHPDRCGCSPRRRCVHRGERHPVT